MSRLDDSDVVLRDLAQWHSPGGELLVGMPHASALSRHIGARIGLVNSNYAVNKGEFENQCRRVFLMATHFGDARTAHLRIGDCGWIVLKSLGSFQLDGALTASPVDQAFITAYDTLPCLFPDPSSSSCAFCSNCFTWDADSPAVKDD